MVFEGTASPSRKPIKKEVERIQIRAENWPNFAKILTIRIAV
jgi:hypothetical protein